MPDTLCHTCGNPDYRPFRVYTESGKVLMGCVDACHTGRLVTPSESARWHARPAAKAIRASLARLRKGVR